MAQISPPKLPVPILYMNADDDYGHALVFLDGSVCVLFRDGMKGYVSANGAVVALFRPDSFAGVTMPLATAAADGSSPSLVDAASVNVPSGFFSHIEILKEVYEQNPRACTAPTPPHCSWRRVLIPPSQTFGNVSPAASFMFSSCKCTSIEQDEFAVRKVVGDLCDMFGVDPPPSTASTDTGGIPPLLLLFCGDDNKSVAQFVWLLADVVPKQRRSSGNAENCGREEEVGAWTFYLQQAICVPLQFADKTKKAKKNRAGVHCELQFEPMEGAAWEDEEEQLAEGGTNCGGLRGVFPFLSQSAPVDLITLRELVRQKKEVPLPCCELSQQKIRPLVRPKKVDRSQLQQMSQPHHVALQHSLSPACRTNGSGWLFSQSQPSLFGCSLQLPSLQLEEGCDDGNVIDII